VYSTRRFLKVTADISVIGVMPKFTSKLIEPRQINRANGDIALTRIALTGIYCICIVFTSTANKYLLKASNNPHAVHDIEDCGLASATQQPPVYDASRRHPQA